MINSLQNYKARESVPIARLSIGQGSLDGRVSTAIRVMKQPSQIIHAAPTASANLALSFCARACSRGGASDLHTPLRSPDACGHPSIIVDTHQSSFPVRSIAGRCTQPLTRSSSQSSLGRCADRYTARLRCSSRKMHPCGHKRHCRWCRRLPASVNANTRPCWQQEALIESKEPIPKTLSQPLLVSRHSTRSWPLQLVPAGSARTPS